MIASGPFLNSACFCNEGKQSGNFCHRSHCIKVNSIFQNISQILHNYVSYQLVCGLKLNKRYKRRMSKQRITGLYCAVHGHIRKFGIYSKMYTTVSMQPNVNLTRTACETAHKNGWDNLQSSNSLVLNELLVQVTRK
jgi:RNase H-fold protein (predicted Holliday junction resolvase)